MSAVIDRFDIDDRVDLVCAIDSVCHGSLHMVTAGFQPTPAWIHALDSPACSDHLLLIARVNRRVVGWCRIFPEDQSIVPQVELGIGLLAPYRLQGLGTALVTESLDWAKGAGYKQVVLQVHPDNRVARHVFEKCGFQYDVTANGQLTMAQCLLVEERRA